MYQWALKHLIGCCLANLQNWSIWLAVTKQICRPQHLIDSCQANLQTSAFDWLLPSKSAELEHLIGCHLAVRNLLILVTIEVHVTTLTQQAFDWLLQIFPSCLDIATQD
jgi:hypothetical protein